MRGEGRSDAERRKVEGKAKEGQVGGEGKERQATLIGMHYNLAKKRTTF